MRNKNTLDVQAQPIGVGGLHNSGSGSSSTSSSGSGSSSLGVPSPRKQNRSNSVHTQSPLSRTSSFLAGGNLGAGGPGGSFRSAVSPLPSSMASGSNKPAGIGSPSGIAMMGGANGDSLPGTGPTGGPDSKDSQQPTAVDKRLFGAGVARKGRTESNATVSNLQYMFPGLSALPGQVVVGTQIGATDKSASGARKIFNKPEENRGTTPVRLRKVGRRGSVIVAPLKPKAEAAEVVKRKHAFDFSEIVDIDYDEVLDDHVSDELMGRLLDSSAFRISILFVILLNSVLIGMQTDKTLEKQFSGVFSATDKVFLTIFVLEILLKWYHGFRIFWKVGWNVFDFVIVLSSVAGPSITFVSSGRVLRILRVLRAFRTLRSISALNGLQVVVHTVLKSVPDMANIILLLLIIMFIFAVVGVTLFGEALPDQFGDMGKNMFTLFILLTQDGWADIFIVVQEKGLFEAGAVYFALFIAIGAFVFVNIIVGVTVTNLQSAYDAINRSTLKKHRSLKVTNNSGEKTNVRETRSTESLPIKVWDNQSAFLLPKFDKISPSQIENYLLVLSAMEDNLFEYKKLKRKLAGIIQGVKQQNEEYTNGDDSSDSETDDSSKESDSEAGDVLSRMIKADELKPSRQRKVNNKVMEQAAQRRANRMQQEEEQQSKMERTKKWASRGNLLEVAEQNKAGKARRFERRSTDTGLVHRKSKREESEDD